MARPHSTFSSRHGYRRPYPRRDRVEEAPERLRAYLVGALKEAWGSVEAYRRLCQILGRVPDPSIWGDAFASPEVAFLVDHLEWWEVFDLLEEVSDPQDDDEVNEVFARCGLAYEMLDAEIHRLDPEGDALQVAGDEHKALSLLTARFAPVRGQYDKALSALHGRPADLEKAISESLGALEAVAHIATGRKDFGRAVDMALDGRPQAGALAATLKALYGWASQVPGARHGRHAEPDLEFEDALLTVRMAGAAIAYIIWANG